MNANKKSQKIERKGKIENVNNIEQKGFDNFSEFQFDGLQELSEPGLCCINGGEYSECETIDEDIFKLSSFAAVLAALGNPAGGALFAIWAAWLNYQKSTGC